MNDSTNLLSLEGLVFEATEIKIDGHVLSITPVSYTHLRDQETEADLL